MCSFLRHVDHGAGNAYSATPNTLLDLLRSEMEVFAFAMTVPVVEFSFKPVTIGWKVKYDFTTYHYDFELTVSFFASQ